MSGVNQARFSRRRLLIETGALSSALLANRVVFGDRSKRRPKVAAIFTVLRFRSHAYNILENFLGPYYFNGKLTDPGVEVAAFYADQFPEDDMAREVSRRFNIPLFKSIEEALCLGGRRLAVEAVLSIGEHGDYPFNKRGQQMYPRKEFFDQAVAVMKRSGQFVPFFNDKHLPYRWDWAREMYDTAPSSPKWSLLRLERLMSWAPGRPLADVALLANADIVNAGGFKLRPASYLVASSADSTMTFESPRCPRQGFGRGVDDRFRGDRGTGRRVDALDTLFDNDLIGNVSQRRVILLFFMASYLDAGDPVVLHRDGDFERAGVGIAGARIHAVSDASEVE